MMNDRFPPFAPVRLVSTFSALCCRSTSPHAAKRRTPKRPSISLAAQPIPKSIERVEIGPAARGIAQAPPTLVCSIGRQRRTSASSVRMVRSRGGKGSAFRPFPPLRARRWTSGPQMLGKPALGGKRTFVRAGVVACCPRFVSLSAASGVHNLGDVLPQ